jgi:hypothetical protein
MDGKGIEVEKAIQQVRWNDEVVFFSFVAKLDGVAGQKRLLHAYLFIDGLSIGRLTADLKIGDI